MVVAVEISVFFGILHSLSASDLSLHMEDKKWGEGATCLSLPPPAPEWVSAWSSPVIDRWVEPKIIKVDID